MRAQWFGWDVARRVPGLMAGLVACGVGTAFMVHARLGLASWDVFHQGISRMTGLQIGTVSVLAGIPILLLWRFLRQWPGIGTVLNIATVGVSTNVALAVIPEARVAGEQVLLFAAGLVTLAIGSGLYLGANLGPGPRDGLMTGIHRRTGISIARVRTVLEVGVVIVGWALGGTVGIGTLVFAVTIGYLTQLTLLVFDRDGNVMLRRRIHGDMDAIPGELAT